MHIATSLFAAITALGLTLHGFTLADMVGVTIEYEQPGLHQHPYGYGGYACLRAFREVSGNVQDWCPDDHAEAGHVVVALAGVPYCVTHAINTGQPANRFCRPQPGGWLYRTLARVIGHELGHLVIGVDHAHADPFREDLATMAGYCASGEPLPQEHQRPGIDACDWRDHIPARGAR